MPPNPDAPPRSRDQLRLEVERLRLLHGIGLELNASLDFDELLPRVFDAVLTALNAEGGSLWIAEGEMLRCRLAMGGTSRRLVGAELPAGTGFVGDVASTQRTTIVTRVADDPRFQPDVDEADAEVASTVMATAMVSQGETVGAIQVVNKKDGGVFDTGDRELLEGLAASAATALRNARLHTAERRARDLALLLEISREITATLDLDRLLQGVVNHAARALTFDRGAVGLIDRGACEIRALAGQDQVDPKDPGVRDLAARALWAAGRGEAFYLSDRIAPLSDAERTFVTVFGDDLAAADVRSALYLPLRDEEGTLGVLAFEADRPEFATETQREVAAILANQTAVALRNAQLYNAVPLADAWSALAQRKRAVMQMPRRRLRLLAAAAVVALAALTLVRWPLRVVGAHPSFRPTGWTDVRAPVTGVIERVAVTEGTPVDRGAVLLQLRDVALEADRAATEAELAMARRAAAVSASRGDAAEERLHRVRAAAIGRELALLDQQLAQTIVRAPLSGVVLSPRPEERLGLSVDPGDPILALGRTDTLELEFAVDQRDISRVELGDEVRLRVNAIPQRTFTGTVVFIGPVPVDTDPRIRYPVRAAVSNPDGLLRPGMQAHARVLTDPASALGRLLRGPTRWLRLLWWRMLG